MTNREDLIETAARAQWQFERETFTYQTESWEGATNHQREQYRLMVAAGFDAVLPQIDRQLKATR